MATKKKATTKTAARGGGRSAGGAAKGGRGGRSGGNRGGGGDVIDTLKELLEEELKDLLSAEQQLLKALPRMSKKAQHPELKAAFDEHTRITEGQVDRLEQVFELLGSKAKAKTCKAMQGLIAEGQEMMKEKMDRDAMDAALIGIAQKVEHYEIASYGTLRTWARRVGLNEAADLLQETLDEEGEADKRLTALAESQINEEAARGEGGGGGMGDEGEDDE